MAQTRSARTIITEAINDNKKVIWFLLVMLTVSIALSIVFFMIGYIYNEPYLMPIGFFFGAYSFRVLSKLIFTQQEITRLRILEYALSRAKTMEEIATVLEIFFVHNGAKK